MPPHTQRSGFDRAITKLKNDGWKFVDAEQFASDTATTGLANLPDDLDDHFGPDGGMRRDLTLRSRDGVLSWLQTAFAREGLVVEVPGQGPDTDSYVGLSAQELAAMREAAIEALLAAEHGTASPREESVTCLATERSSDLCRMVAAFDRLAGHGYIAEPACWPTTSGCWEQVYQQAEKDDSEAAVFWNTQNHDSCFDPRGDLAGSLFVHWMGDPDLIAECLLDTGLAVKKPQSDGTTFILHSANSVGTDDKITVVLESPGDNPIRVVETLRKISADLSIAEVQRLVADAPQPILTQAGYWDAQDAREQLTAAGARTTLRCDCVVRVADAG